MHAIKKHTNTVMMPRGRVVFKQLFKIEQFILGTTIITIIIITTNNIIIILTIIIVIRTIYKLKTHFKIKD